MKERLSKSEIAGRLRSAGQPTGVGHESAPPAIRRPRSRPPSTAVAASWRGAFPAALSTVLTASAAPYGYTVSIWTSGAVVMSEQGPPHPPEAFAFAGGAVAGFTVLGVFANRALRRAIPFEEAADRVRAGLLHWFAVGAAVGLAALIAEVQSWIAWPLVSLAATAVYLAAASAQLAVVTAHRESRRKATSRRGR